MCSRHIKPLLYEHSKVKHHTTYETNDVRETLAVRTFQSKTSYNRYTGHLSRVLLYEHPKVRHHTTAVAIVSSPLTGCMNIPKWNIIQPDACNVLLYNIVDALWEW